VNDIGRPNKNEGFSVIRFSRISHCKVPSNSSQRMQALEWLLNLID